MTPWQGKTPHSVHWKFYMLCGLFFWLIIPLFLVWKRYRHIQNTLYYLDERGAGIENAVNPDANRFLDLDRITSVETKPLGNSQLSNVLIHTVNKQIPPLIFTNVSIHSDIVQSFEKHVEAARSKINMKSISIPILQ
jgi:hypothetical protein